ncbi:MAG: ATP-binding protein [Clostridia bacterium]|nr:ATP-binding protein [Clostridia bacterium]
MKIVKIRISNYKSYSPSGCEIPFTDITGFIGPNSAGKTNILEALDWFFHPAKLTDPSFFHKSNTDDPIHIDVTFKCPEVDSEYAVCKKLLCTENGEITLRRTYRWSENKKQAETDKDFTPTFMWEYCDSYKALESPTVKPSTAKKYAGVPEDFRTSEEYRFFVDKVGDTVSSEANFSAMVSAFILNSSYEELKQNRVIQWKPVDESKLPKGAKDFIKSLPIPEYLYLPVEYSVTDELSAKKGTRFSSIMSSLMDDINEENRTQKQKDFENLLQQIERYSEKYLDLPLQRINDILGTPSTQWNFTGASINIQRKEVDMENALKPEWKLSVDDGFCSDISTKGSGMQRIALLQMLQTYIDMCPAKQSSYRKIILAIEEPELYLHPPYRRSLYNVFREIKDRIQVCYTTHDPIFVQMEYFDEVRLVCKKSPSESTVYYTDWSLFEGDEWKDFFKSRT